VKKPRKRYDAADNGARGYNAAVDAIRMEGVKAGRFLPLASRPEEIKASPIVEEARQIGPCTLYRGDCRQIVALLEGMAACVTDPPYELGFMGKSWDSSGIAADWRTWGAVRIALRPGAHLVAFAGSRTYHRIASAVDDAGFDVRDQIMWIYGSGFPKSRKVSDDLERAGIGHYTVNAWDGWGTALKPAHEPIVFARKPLSEATIAANVLRWGTAALNIDACRMTPAQDHQDKCASVVGAESRRTSTVYSENKAKRRDSSRKGEASADRRYADEGVTGFAPLPGPRGGDVLGRWPANMLTDGSHEVIEAFPASARDAIRFFYAPKADKAEREFGMEDAPTKAGGMRSNTSGQHITRRDGGAPGPRANHHPTVKPVDLMRWLCRLVTPPGGTVLDPFMGSGSTGIAAVREGFGFVGIEQDADYFDIACRRIEAAVRLLDVEPDIVRAVQRVRAEQGELI